MPKTYDINLILLSSFSWLNIFIELSKGRKMTGYDILGNVNKFGLSVSGGTVYRQLGILEDAGLIQANPVRRGRTYKTVYKITEKGMEAFQQFKEKWREALEYTYKNLHG